MENNWRNAQLFFLHIHKTAGTSFINLLDQSYTVDEVCPSNWPYRQRLHEVTQDELRQARFVRGHFSYDGVMNQSIQKPFTLIFLRDPVMRFVSHYEHLKRSEGDPPGIHERIAHLSLEKFLLEPELFSAIANMGARLLCGFEPDQYVAPPHLAVAKERLASFDFIGLTEEFEKSIIMFSHVFNLPGIRYLHHENVSPNKSARSQIESRTLDRIVEINQIDIELYEFGRQLFYKQVQNTQKSELSVVDELPAGFYSNFQYVDPGQGWYIGESHPSLGIIRWSGPELVSYLRIPELVEQDYTLSFCIAHAIDPEVLAGLTVEMNGFQIALTKRDGNDPNTGIFDGVILHSYLKQDVTSNILAFKVQKTVRPCDIQIDNPDTRLLGLCYNWLRIEPTIQWTKEMTETYMLGL